MKIFAAVALFTLAGCVTSSRVFEVGPGTYSVSSTGDGYSSATRVINDVMGQADAYCKKQGHHLVVIDQTQGATRMGIDTTVTVNFRCE